MPKPSEKTGFGYHAERQHPHPPTQPTGSSILANTAHVNQPCTQHLPPVNHQPVSVVYAARSRRLFSARKPSSHSVSASSCAIVICSGPGTLQKYARLSMARVRAAFLVCSTPRRSPLPQKSLDAPKTMCTRSSVCLCSWWRFEDGRQRVYVKSMKQVGTQGWQGGGGGCQHK